MTDQRFADFSNLYLQPNSSPALSDSRPMSRIPDYPSTRDAQSLAADIRNSPPLLHFYAERPLNQLHHYKNISESTTASNDSSPTTTISTVDDSSATETSPGSSPESPPPSTFALSMLRPRTAHGSEAPFFELQKQPPPRKGRNLKNLAVNTSRNPGRAASTTCLPLDADTTERSSIASPTFVRPPEPPRRRPSNLGLTLLTPGKTKAPHQEIRIAIPPTPAFGRPGALRHFQSSPSLPLLSALGTAGHVARASAAPTTLDTIFSPTSSTVTALSEERIEANEDEDQNFEVPLSKEEKPAAYPNGPICIYEPYIDLYLEPTAEQCRQYDVIMNVASEVRNPLEDSTAPQDDPAIRIDGGGGIQYAPVRPLDKSRYGSGEVMPGGSPTTPKATPMHAAFSRAKNDHWSTTSDTPEYIHIPWEHNTDIVPELLGLVKLIDERVRQGKRILIHCQCGVSRSASLVVAYGIYKNPTQSVQEAYDAVKQKSKWIGPNMNLIMQLQEFRTSLTRGGTLSNSRGTLSPLTPGSALSTWQGQLGHVLPLRDDVSTKEAISPGPSSAPSGVGWPSDDSLSPPAQTVRARAVSAVRPGTTNPGAFVDPSGHIVPVLRLQNISDASRTPRSVPPAAIVINSPVQSPHVRHFPMTTLRPPSSVDPADDFDVRSPTTAEFSHAPIDRSALLASLGMGSVHGDESPRRSLSLRTKAPPPSQPSPQRASRLRTRISSPSLREQQQLQNLQAKIEASLPSRLADVQETLMSPRATEFTKNPFALSSLEANVQSVTSGILDEDPRSPVSGANPINRSILDVL